MCGQRLPGQITPGDRGPAFPGRVTRDADGPLLIAVDRCASWPRPRPIGLQFTLSTRGSIGGGERGRSARRRRGRTVRARSPGGCRRGLRQRAGAGAPLRPAVRRSAAQREQFMAFRERALRRWTGRFPPSGCVNANRQRPASHRVSRDRTLRARADAWRACAARNGTIILKRLAAKMAPASAASILRVRPGAGGGILGRRQGRRAGQAAADKRCLRLRERACGPGRRNAAHRRANRQDRARPRMFRPRLAGRRFRAFIQDGD